MKTFRTLPVILLALGVAGCAALPKPEMTEQQYSEASRNWYALHQCNQQGFIPPEVVASGVHLITQNLAGYSYDSGKLDAMVRILERSYSPTVGDCNQIALVIHTNTPKVVAQQPAYVAPVYVPKNTFCNRVGTQMLCNSF